MKKLKMQFIRFCTPILCLLLLLPSFGLWAVAEPENGAQLTESEVL